VNSVQIEQVDSMDEREQLLGFVQEVFGGYAEGMQSPDFDHRSYLASIVLQAYLVYVQFELKPNVGNC
jgi:hypothetical protein